MATPEKTPAQKVEYPYEITATRDQMSVDPTGRLVASKVVFYKTIFGDTGHIEILKSQFTEKAVREMIHAEIDELLKLHGY